jgi:hypothetical protein
MYADVEYLFIFPYANQHCVILCSHFETAASCLPLFLLCELQCSCSVMNLYLVSLCEETQVTVMII